MWKCEAAHLKPLMSDGERFPHLMDRLIRASAAKCHVQQSEIQTQLRTNIKDGGVDTQVDVAFHGCGLGWFNEKSCWQFKAQDAIDEGDVINKSSKNELQKEVHKPYAKKLIKDGYAYRL